MSGEKLYLFGSPHLERDGVLIEIKRRKALALLAYLAVNGRGYSRSALASIFWPELDESRSRTNLRRVLSDLNQTLGDSWADTQEDRIALHPDAIVWVDANEFRRRIAAGVQHDHASDEICADCVADLRAAVDLYRDDFLAGFFLPDCPEFEEWQFFEREDLSQQLASALSRLVDGNRSAGDVDAAITYARRLLSFEPWNEEPTAP